MMLEEGLGYNKAYVGKECGDRNRLRIERLLFKIEELVDIF